MTATRDVAAELRERYHLLRPTEKLRRPLTRPTEKLRRPLTRPIEKLRRPLTPPTEKLRRPLTREAAAGRAVVVHRVVVRSMTGFGAGEAHLVLQGREVRVRVDVRSVNHRFLDVRSRVASSLADHAPALEELVGKRLRRGHVEIGVRVEGRVEPAPVLDLEVARSAYAQLVKLRDELSPGEPVPLGLLATVPGLFVAAPSELGQELRAALLDAAKRACDAVDAMRAREGTALAEELGTRLESVRAKLAQIRLRCPALVDAQRARLRDRLARMMSEHELTLDETRVEHEVALFAERTDVAEEVARLDSHCDQFDELMNATGPAHGRKLDFLLQEMAREVNTLGAKTPEVEITRVVVEIKADVERMREQVQNVL